MYETNAFSKCKMLLFFNLFYINEMEKKKIPIKNIIKK